MTQGKEKGIEIEKQIELEDNMKRRNWEYKKRGKRRNRNEN